ncbi:hypothetical protein [Halegenticoccus soli]|uniref:hypothetical protein n=1 Tax=Halegenticoccus soli TaxID=1985678 RepID=UPI001E605E11|nr:hypothetical protein [Halegenticoccus soli]
MADGAPDPWDATDGTDEDAGAADGNASVTNGTADAAYGARIRDLAEAARRERDAFVPPADPPAEERAMSYLRSGLGPVVALYVEARTGGRTVAFSAEEFALLQRATNDWLSLYARCYGVEMDAEFTVREAAELLVRTHNIRDTAQLLTRVPAR